MAPHESNSSRLFICSKQAELLQSKWRNIVDSVASLHQSTQHSGGIFQIFQIVLLLKQLVKDRLEFFFVNFDISFYSVDFEYKDIFKSDQRFWIFFLN